MPELICALGPDSAGTVITDLIRGARVSLDVAMYEVGPSYAWTLAAAARRGVRVRTLLDGHGANGNASTAVDVDAAGGACRVLPRVVAPGHWKLLLVDGARVAVGTGNLLWRDAPRDSHGRLPPDAPSLRGTREWWAITDDHEVTTAAGSALEVAWQAAVSPPQAWRELPRRHRGRPAPLRGAQTAAAVESEGARPGGVGVPAPQVQPLRLAAPSGFVHLVVGGLAVAATIRDAIEQATSRVYITVPYLQSRAAGVRNLIAAARRAHRAGTDVRILLGAAPPRRDATYLLAAAVPARWMDPVLSTRGHAKGVIADQTAVLTSANWSRTGLGRNWEAALVMRSRPAAGYLAGAWERDWAAARPVEPTV